MSQFDELPEGWLETALEDISFRITKGTTPTSLGFQYTEGGILFVKVESLTDGKINHSDCAFIDDEADKALARSQLKEKDILFSIAGTLGRIAIVQNSDLPANTNQALAIIRLVPPVDVNYIAKALSSHLLEESIRSGGRGVGLKNLNLKQVSEFSVPLPPLNEQRRIVEKIEALTARSRKARAALDEIPALLDQFRQSVLAAAFRGDLTADWRAQNPNVEPAEALLERIRTERRKRWEASIKLRSESSSKYKIPFELDIDKLPELPDSWTWGSLDQLLFSLRNGLSRKPAEEMPGIPILRISALRPMALNINDVRYYQPSNGENIDSYLLEEGDLLFTRYNGNRDFVGVCGSVKKLTGKLLHPDKLIRGKPVSSHLFDPSFLEIACNSGISRRFIDGYVKTSAGQHGISGSDLKRTPIPIPPIDEQYAIMALVNKQFGIIDNLQILIENKFDEFQVFDQSILTKAFRGELVPQDPNDEPASVLLDRIRAERERLGGGKKRGKAKA